MNRVFYNSLITCIVLLMISGLITPILKLTTPFYVYLISSILSILALLVTMILFCYYLWTKKMHLALASTLLLDILGVFYLIREILNNPFDEKMTVHIITLIIYSGIFVLSNSRKINNFKYYGWSLLLSGISMYSFFNLNFQVLAFIFALIVLISPVFLIRQFQFEIKKIKTSDYEILDDI